MLTGPNTNGARPSSVPFHSANAEYHVDVHNRSWRTKATVQPENFFHPPRNQRALNRKSSH